MDQTSAMEAFLLLAKIARGRAAADIVQKATEDPAIFAFGELLEVPGIQEVRTQVCPSFVHPLSFL